MKSNLDSLYAYFPLGFMRCKDESALIRRVDSECWDSQKRQMLAEAIPGTLVAIERNGPRISAGRRAWDPNKKAFVSKIRALCAPWGTRFPTYRHERESLSGAADKLCEGTARKMRRSLLVLLTNWP